MGQPVCAHANDWAGMIKPNGPVDFYIPMGYDMNGALPPLRWCGPLRALWKVLLASLFSRDYLVSRRAGMGVIVNGEGVCSSGDETATCSCWNNWADPPKAWFETGKCPLKEPQSTCKDGSTCLKANVSGYGGNGHIASANSPLPGLMMSLDQFEQAGVPANRVVVGVPWCTAPKALTVSVPAFEVPARRVDCGCGRRRLRLPLQRQHHGRAVQRHGGLEARGAAGLILHRRRTARELVRSQSTDDRKTHSRCVSLGCRTTGIKYNETTVSAWFDYDCVVVPNASKTACKGAGRHQASKTRTILLGLCKPCLSERASAVVSAPGAL